MTKRFIETCEPVFGYPRIVRFSWSTATKALENIAYKVEFDDEDEENVEKQTFGSKKLTKFFKAETNGVRKIERHNFFKERCLEDVMEF